MNLIMNRSLVYGGDGGGGDGGRVQCLDADHDADHRHQSGAADYWV